MNLPSSSPIVEDAKIPRLAKFGFSSSISPIDERSSLMQQTTRKPGSRRPKVSRFDYYSSPDAAELRRRKLSSSDDVESKRKKSSMSDIADLKMKKSSFSAERESKKRTVSFFDGVNSKKRKTSSSDDAESKRKKSSTSDIADLKMKKSSFSAERESKKRTVSFSDEAEPKRLKTSSPDDVELKRKKSASLGVAEGRKGHIFSPDVVESKAGESLSSDAAESKRKKLSSSLAREINSDKATSSGVAKARGDEILSPDVVEPTRGELPSLDGAESRKKKSSSSKKFSSSSTPQHQTKKFSSPDVAESKKKKFASSHVAEKSKRKKSSTLSGPESKLMQLNNVKIDGKWETIFEQTSVDSIGEEELPDGKRYGNALQRKQNLSDDSDEVGNWSDTRYPWEEMERRMRSIEAIRDALPCVEDIPRVLDKPLFPQVLPPEDGEEWPCKDAEKLQVPETQTLFSNGGNNNEIFGTESDDSEELHVQRPLKTHERSLASKILAEASSPNFSYFPSYEAERLWDKHFAAEAKERCQRLQALQQRKIIQHPNAMQKFRERAVAASEVIRAKRKKKPTGRKKSKEEQTPSPRMVTVRCENLFSVDGPTYTTIDSDGHVVDVDDPFDPNSRLNQLEDEMHAGQLRERRMNQKSINYSNISSMDMVRGTIKKFSTETRTRGKKSLPPKKMVLRSAKISGKTTASSSTSSEDDDQSHKGIDETRDLVTEARARRRRRLPLTKIDLALENTSSKTVVTSSASEDDDKSHREINKRRDFMAEARARSKNRLPLTKMVLGLEGTSTKTAVISSSSEDDDQELKRIHRSSDFMAEARVRGSSILPLAKIVPGLEETSAKTDARSSTFNSRISRPTVTSIIVFEEPVVKLVTQQKT